MYGWLIWFDSFPFYVLAARHRAEANGQNLTEEWERNAELKRRKKEQDELRNASIQRTMAEMLKQQEEAERERRERQREAQRKYQLALDEQVNQLRQRSFDNLTSKCNLSLSLSLCFSPSLCLLFLCYISFLFFNACNCWVF